MEKIKTYGYLSGAEDMKMKRRIFIEGPKNEFLILENFSSR